MLGPKKLEKSHVFSHHVCRQMVWCQTAKPSKPRMRTFRLCLAEKQEPEGGQRFGHGLHLGKKFHLSLAGIIDVCCLHGFHMCQCVCVCVCWSYQPSKKDTTTGGILVKPGQCVCVFCLKCSSYLHSQKHILERKDRGYWDRFPCGILSLAEFFLLVFVGWFLLYPHIFEDVKILSP